MNRISGESEAQHVAPAAGAPPAWLLTAVQESQQTLAADEHRRDAVRRHVADMLAMERRLGETLGRQVEWITAPALAAAAVRRFQAMIGGHQGALEARLEGLGGPPTGQVAGATIAPAGGGNDARGPHAVAAALLDDYAAFNHAAISYTMLHHTAHVFFDLQTVQLAAHHLHGYAGAAQEINQLMADVVAWAFREEGQRCLCKCPGCALGVCLCVASTITATDEAWRETAPAPQERGVAVVCSASRPATLDLQDGDVLTAVDGREVRAWPDAIAAIIGRAPGEPVRLQVERGGVPVHLIATRR